MTDITIGADISKDHIDLYSLPNGQTLKVANDRKGFAAILKWIGTTRVVRIVYEPTGPYHKAFERLMMVQRVDVSKVNPRLARRFAEATGRLPRQTRSMPDFWRVTARFLNRASLRATRKSSMT